VTSIKETVLSIKGTALRIKTCEIYDCFQNFLILHRVALGMAAVALLAKVVILWAWQSDEGALATT
jgi:hypothetical protein